MIGRGASVVVKRTGPKQFGCLSFFHRNQSSGHGQGHGHCSDQSGGGGINNNSIYLLSIPITTRKSYIYCHHKKSLLDATQLKKVPWRVRLEDKVVGIATKGWTKMSTSQNKVNQAVTKFVTKLLDTIPYEESCLRSFPSQKLMIREINEESLEEVRSKTESVALLQAHLDTLKIGSDQLKPIPCYHPSVQSPQVIIDQLRLFRDDAYAKHVKYAIICAVGIPITLPFALVPVLPNVPGIYLTYRLYCNVKALVGIRHLNYLIGPRKPMTEPSKSTPNLHHIQFRPLAAFNAIYSGLINSNPASQEQVVISKDLVHALCTELNLPQLKDDLLKALRQEIHRLQRAGPKHPKDPKNFKEPKNSNEPEKPKGAK